MNLLDLSGKGWYAWLGKMRIDEDREDQEQEVLGEKARRVGTRHLLIGFLGLLLLMFLLAWCSMPGR
ncbi:MAG: hypothetical protein U9R33_01220 [candidate division NC10 bacterium]|nr:hypothetical protein [candidate division NC10 bacterium]